MMLALPAVLVRKVLGIIVRALASAGSGGSICALCDRGTISRLGDLFITENEFTNR